MPHIIKYLDTTIGFRGRRIPNPDAPKCHAAKIPSVRDDNPKCNNKASVEIDGKGYCYIHAQTHAFEILVKEAEENGTLVTA